MVPSTQRYVYCVKACSLRYGKNSMELLCSDNEVTCSFFEGNKMEFYYITSIPTVGNNFQFSCDMTLISYNRLGIRVSLECKCLNWYQILLQVKRRKIASNRFICKEDI